MVLQVSLRRGSSSACAMWCSLVKQASPSSPHHTRLTPCVTLVDVHPSGLNEIGLTPRQTCSLVR